MLSILRPALSLLAAFTLVTGVAYPLAITGVSQTLFHREANGSIVDHGGQKIGSSLIGQSFSDVRHFWGRPSATAPSAYNGGASTGSNLGPTNDALLTAVRERVETLHKVDPESARRPIPVDLITASGSGLDPHISPAAALYQVRRVAHARGLKEEDVRSLVERHIEGRTFGILGEPRVNVLLLNVALDE